MRTVKHVLILVAVVGPGLAGCSSGTTDAADPVASASTVTPVTLSLGTGDPRGRPDTVVVERLRGAGRPALGRRDARSRSPGRPQESPEGRTPSSRASSASSRPASLIWAGSPTRAWDTVDVSSFQALQAPFLITDQSLLGRGARRTRSRTRCSWASRTSDSSDSASTRISSATRSGTASRCRSVGDFDGAGIRLVPSNATEALVHAFGGQPVYGLNGDEIDAAIQNGELDGTETSIGLAPEGSFLTGNVILFPRVNTLFASEDGLASLSDEQRTILEDAARATIDFAASTQSEDVTAFCSAGGQIVAASDADITELTRAARPVLDMLMTDPQTAAFIEEIGVMKDGATAAAPPTSCDPT